MLKIDVMEMEHIRSRIEELPQVDSSVLQGSACSASDTSCGCGWDCSSSKT